VLLERCAVLLGRWRRGRPVLSRKVRRRRIAVELGRRWRSDPLWWWLRIRMRQRLELLGVSAFYGLHPCRLCTLERLLLLHVLLRRGLFLLHLPPGQLLHLLLVLALKRLHLLLVLLLGLWPRHRSGPAGLQSFRREVLLLRRRLLFQPLLRLPLWARWR